MQKINMKWNQEFTENLVVGYHDGKKSSGIFITEAEEKNIFTIDMVFVDDFGS